MSLFNALTSMAKTDINSNNKRDKEEEVNGPKSITQSTSEAKRPAYK